MPRTRVLIVDDQPAFRRAARDVLEARGYAVVAEADGQAAALDAVARCTPDAVLLDVCLGSESGFDVAPALLRAAPHLAVLMVSAEERQGCAQRVRASGARGFVAKARLAEVDLATYWRGAEGLSGAGSGVRSAGSRVAGGS